MDFKVREISIRPTTDTLREIGTVTKDSIPIAFKGVQVQKERREESKLNYTSETYALLQYFSCLDKFTVTCNNAAMDKALLFQAPLS